MGQKQAIDEDVGQLPLEVGAPRVDVLGYRFVAAPLEELEQFGSLDRDRRCEVAGGLVVPELVSEDAIAAAESEG